MLCTFGPSSCGDYKEQTRFSHLCALNLDLMVHKNVELEWSYLGFTLRSTSLRASHFAGRLLGIERRCLSLNFAMYGQWFLASGMPWELAAETELPSCREIKFPLSK